MKRTVRHGMAGVTALLLAAAWSVGAEKSPPRPAKVEEKKPPTLQKKVEDLVGTFEKSTRGTAGVFAWDLAGGKPVLAVEADLPKIPASNEKLLTSAFALARLGPEFSFTTAVYLAGNDLFVMGDGDPTLGDPILAQENGTGLYDEIDRWAAAVREKVGPKVKGDLLVCGSANKDLYRHENWPKAQHGNWYAAPVAGLNFNNNCLDVTFRGKSSAVVPVLSPVTAQTALVNNLKPGPRHAWSLKTNDDDSVVTLLGTVSGPSSEPVSTAINNPPLLVGRVLLGRLEAAGVAVAGKVRTAGLESVDLAKAKELARTQTPLATALRRANKRSLNMTAECIFLRSGDGTWSGSAKLAAETLTKEYGLDAKTLTIDDGGGLSRANRVSPANLVRLLAAMRGKPFADVLLKSLPVSGTDGTLEKRLTGKYQGRVLGKTGYIAGVSCLSGYVLDAKGQPAVAFSVMVNQIAGPAEAKKLQDAIAAMLVDSLPDK